MYQADVVVIGGGLAGMVTTLELLDAGKSVVMLDSAPAERWGGLAKLSFGGVFFVNSPEQKKSGFSDSVELALTDWYNYAEFEDDAIWPKRWAEAYVTNSLRDVRQWMMDRGVKFLFAVNWTERGYFVPGNSVPRFHIAWGTGEGITDAMIERIEAHPNRSKLTVHFDHRVEDLVSEGGQFVGCHGVTTAGQAFEARGEAVVIAAGGIAGNLDKVREVWPTEWGTPPRDMLNGSILEADGHLLERAEAAGANVTHLSNMWNYAAGIAHPQPHFENHGLSMVPGKSALWVNYRGRRFNDPPLVGAYDTHFLIDRIVREEKKYSWTVMNFKIAAKEFAISGAEHNPAVRNKQFLKFVMGLLRGKADMVQDFIENCEDFVAAGSVAELADKMNGVTGTNDVDAATLAREIAAYDANIARGKTGMNDDQLRRIEHCRKYRGDRLRTCKFAQIDDRSNYPLIAIRNRIITRKSLGGLQVDLAGRVLTQAGEPMPGLYAAGEACGFGGGGMHGKRALEGTFLGGCIYSGQVVARGIVEGRSADQNA